MDFGAENFDLGLMAVFISFHEDQIFIVMDYLEGQTLQQRLRSARGDDLPSGYYEEDFTPTETIGFVFQLKSVIRAELGDRIRALEKWNELADLESRIDRVALLAFDKYTECREQLHRVRNREIQSRATKVLERVKVESAISLDEEEPTDDDA